MKGEAVRPIFSFLLIVVFGLAPSAPDSAYAQSSTGFTFCAAPHRPACVSANANELSAEACDLEVKSYIAMVFRYRECLEAESERAVRESNDVIDHWRCRQTGERCGR